MMIRRNFLLTLTALLVTAGAWAQADAPIRVGLTSSQSGPFRALASEFLSGVQFWVRDINERGSLLGRRVELVVHDDESSAERAAELYERLITEDQVDLLIGPFSSTLTLAVSDVTERHGFPMVVEATAPIVFSRGHENVFGIYTSADHNMDDVIRLAAERGMSRLALAHQASEFPSAVAEGVRGSAPDAGLAIVFDESYAEDATDLTALARSMASSNPELIIVGAYLDDAVAFMEALKSVRYSPKMLAISGAPSLLDFGQRLGIENADGVVATTQWMRDGRIPGAFDFGFRFRAEYGAYPSYNAAGGYAAGQVLEAAARLAQSLDRAAVREQLSTMRFQSLLGTFQVDDTGRQIGSPIYLVQWQDGHRSLVYPEQLARFPMRHPFPPWESR